MRLFGPAGGKKVVLRACSSCWITFFRFENKEDTVGAAESVGHIGKCLVPWFVRL